MGIEWALSPLYLETEAAPFRLTWNAGGKSYMKLAVNKLKVTWLLLLLADLVIGIITPSTSFRLAPFCRIALFATNSSDVRRELFLLVQVIPGLSSLLLLALLNLSFFAFFGLVLFHDVEGAAHYFGSLGKAFWQLLVLQTTCNFPDVRSTVLTGLGLACELPFCAVGLRLWAGFPSWSLP